MTDLIVVPQAAHWQRLKSLVPDSVSSPITKRVYNLGRDEFFAWFELEPRPGFTKATVSVWRVALAGSPRRGPGGKEAAGQRKSANEGPTQSTLAAVWPTGPTARCRAVCALLAHGAPSRQLDLWLQQVTVG